MGVSLLQVSFDQFHLEAALSILVSSSETFGFITLKISAQLSSFREPHLKLHLQLQKKSPSFIIIFFFFSITTRITVVNIRVHTAALQFPPIERSIAIATNIYSSYRSNLQSKTNSRISRAASTPLTFIPSDCSILRTRYTKNLLKAARADITIFRDLHLLFPFQRSHRPRRTEG